MRKFAPLAIFALAVAVAACGGGGGGKSILPSTITPTAGIPASTKTANAKISLYIPAPSHQDTRKPLYISSSTRAFGVLVVPATSSETPTPLNLTIFPLVTPSPCSQATGGAYTCVLTVSAPIGSDIFYLAAFATASPSANAVPLSEYASGPVTVTASSATTPLSFTLAGVVDYVTLTVPSPDPTGGNTQLFGAGVASGIYPLGITAYDSTNTPILVDPTITFATPLPISVLPATGDVALALGTSTCASGTQARHRNIPVTTPTPSAAPTPTFAGGSTSINITCAGDLNNVTFGYVGTTTANSSGNITDTFSISASAQQSPSPAPSPATVKLASNVVLTEVYANSSSVNPQAVWLYTMPSTGQLLFEYQNSGSEQGFLGTYSPATGAISTGQVDGLASDYGLGVALNGNLWINNNGPLDCWTSVANAIGGNTPQESGLYPSTSLGDPIYPQAMTIDSAGNLWYAGYDNNSDSEFYGQEYVGYFNPSSYCTASPPGIPTSQEFELSGDSFDNTLFMQALPGGGVVTQSNNSGAVYFATTASPSTISGITPQLAAALGVGVAVDAAGNTFGVNTSDDNYFDADVELSTGGGVFSQRALLPPQGNDAFVEPEPNELAAFSPGGSGAATALAYTDEYYDALGLIESPATGTPIVSLVPFPYAEAFSSVFGSEGDPYTLYLDGSDNVWLAHSLPTTTWAVPILNIAGGCSADAMLPILETGDSGPFTVSTTGGFTTTPLPGTDHDFVLAGTEGTTTQITATVSAGGRTENYATSVYIRNPNTCGARRRPSHKRRP